LDSASYVLPRGARVGLVGRNGCGKSTFLRILAEACGGEATSGGKVECPRDVKVAFVEQEPPSPSDVTVSDALSVSTGGLMSVYEAVRQYRLASLNASDDPDGFATAAQKMDATNGWAVLTKADEVSTRLRVKHLEDQPLSSLSGGERKRVALAAALVQEPDVLILDEPTNHLDLAAIRWLGDLVQEKRKMTLLTVTHDRAFLAEVCNSILELDRGTFYSHPGSYQTYLEGKEERLANEDQAIRDAKTKYRRELEWMRRQPQARETKQKARIDAFYKLEKSTKPRVTDPSLELTDGQRRLGGNILKLRNVSLSFGENKKMLDDFSYDFNKGDRIGIVGRNGVGKSTFVKIITEQQAIDSGSIEAGETVVFGLYDQMGIPFLNEQQTVLDFVKDRVESGSGASMAEAPSEAMKLLKQFQFPRQRWNERVSMLSGGERRRLQLLSVLTKRPNFLILDEPTNDIDLDTLTALESYLEDFKGVLVIVSHDRSFTDKVTNHLFVFEGNGIVKDYLGSLSDYAECLVEQEKTFDTDTGSSSSADSVDSETKKILHKEDREKRNQRRNAIKKMKRELSKIEPAIEKLKTKAKEIQAKIDDSSDEGWTVLAELTEKVQALNEEVEEKEMEWLEIAD
ncbi:ABC transporter, partial [Thalassiosira pseudonana CCMP1335]